MILDDSPAFPATFLGAMRIGAVPVPVNPMDRIDNYAYYLDDSYARVLVVEASLLAGLEAVLAERPDLQVLVAGGEAGGHPSFDAVVAERMGELPAPLDTHPDDMAFWLYSSGSTGRPKGVVHRHGGHRGHRRDLRPSRVAHRRADDVCYSTTKLFHAYGLGNGLSFPLSVGARSVLRRGRAVPDQIFETVRRHPPDAVLLGAGALCGDGEITGGRTADFSSVRACVSAAEPAAGRCAGTLAADHRAFRSSTGSAPPRCSTSTARTRSRT